MAKVKKDPKALKLPAEYFKLDAQGGKGECCGDPKSKGAK